MGCARCHAHKYDPITQKEFYQFFAFFNSVPEQGLDGRTGNAAPVLPLPSHRAAGPARRARRGHQAARAGARGRHRRSAAARVGEDAAAAGPRGVDVDADGLLAHYELDGNFSDISGRLPARPDGHRRSDLRCAARSARAVSFDGDTEVSFGNVGRFDRDGPFTIAFWLKGARQPADQRVPETERCRGAATSGGSTTF